MDYSYPFLVFSLIMIISIYVYVFSFVSIMSKWFRVGMTLDYNLSREMKKSVSSMKKLMYKVRVQED